LHNSFSSATSDCNNYCNNYSSVSGSDDDGLSEDHVGRTGDVR